MSARLQTLLVADGTNIPLTAEAEQVKSMLASTPRPGGPAVTAVRPTPQPAELAKAAAAGKRRADLTAMFNATPPTERALRDAIQAQIDTLG